MTVIYSPSRAAMKTIQERKMSLNKFLSLDLSQPDFLDNKVIYYLVCLDDMDAIQPHVREVINAIATNQCEVDFLKVNNLI